MAVWEIKDWVEVERLASVNLRCIRPGQGNYEAAKQDFERDDVRYFGHSVPRYNLSFLPERKGYVRIVLLPIDGLSAFVDCAALNIFPPAHITESESHSIYKNLEEIGQLLEREGISHFYV